MVSLDPGVVSVELARSLRAGGLTWSPAAGDRFVIDKPGLDTQVFVLSDMTVEVHEYPTGRVIGFNGTTEWALDSVAQEETLWLPREDQLRSLLAATFVRLEQVPGHDDAPGFHRVTTVVAGQQHTFDSATPAQAYALALLDLVVRAAD